MITEEKETEDAWIELKSGGVPHRFLDESMAISQLLRNDELFMGANPAKEEKTIMLFVLCNDLFYWGCADAEPISPEELEIFYTAWLNDKRWGTQKWVCRKRSLRPQVPIVKSMKEAGVWDDAMELLPAPAPS